MERDAAAGAIVPFGAQTRNARPMGTETPGGPCTCSWNPSRLWVPNGMRRCGLSCVVQLRAQTSWSRCPETVSNRVGVVTELVSSCTAMAAKKKKKKKNKEHTGTSSRMGASWVPGGTERSAVSSTDSWARDLSSRFRSAAKEDAPLPHKLQDLYGAQRGGLSWLP